jgi:sugar lactone lactonase YvrE
MYNKSGTTVAGITSKYGRDLNQLFWPNCVYLDSKQNIYICDTTNNRIVKYSQSNAQVQFIDFSSGTKLPRRLYIDHRTDDLYLLDLNQDNNYRIHYLPQNPTKSKETILLTGSQTDSFGMTLDLDLNIYVSESANHRVVKWLSPDYEEYLVVAGNGIPGYELNQLTSPKGIYLDLVNNDLYVADEHRIQRWPSRSSIGQTVGLTGVQYPQDIQRDCHGNFYVTVDDTIKLFSQSVETTGLEGLVLVGVPSNDKSVKYTNITELLLNPQGIYLDMKNGDLYVADTGLHRIQKFSINNEFVPGMYIKVQNKQDRCFYENLLF